MAEAAPFDVCLSFAGEHRDYVRRVYEALTLRGVECFFDEPHQVELWGQDIAARFDEVFRKEAQFCVACVSSEWVRRTWPSHERRSAIARMIEEPGYLLPVRFDDTEVPGLSPTIGYLNGTVLEPYELADLITRKVKRRPRYDYVPPNPNRLFAALGIEADDEEGQLRAISRAEAFLAALQSLGEKGREMVLFILGWGCPCRAPESVHMPIDRIVKAIDASSPEQVMGALAEIRRSPEFTLSGLLDENGSTEEGFDLCLTWEPRTPKAPPGAATDLANLMIREAGYQACDSCHSKALDRLDFSRMSSLLDWSGDDFEVLDENAAPSALRDLVGCLLDEGWAMEMTFDQLRFLEPQALFYEVVPLEDRHSPECLDAAKEKLEGLLYGFED